MIRADDLAPRILRAATRDEFPYPASVCADRRVVVRLEDAADELWRASEAQHLLTAVDVVRLSDGLGYLFPACEGALTAALAARQPLRAGEAVSIAVSLLRGAGEATGLCAEGRWWLTDEGRPVLALGGDREWIEDTAAILTELSRGQQVDVERAIASAVAAVTGGSARRLDAEEALFAVAEPAPLRPVVAKGVSTTPAAPSRNVAATEGALARTAGRAVAIFDTGVAEQLRVALTAFVRPRRPRAGEKDGKKRRGVRLAAAAAAAAVLVGGFAWPDADGREAAPAPSTSTSPSASVSGGDGSVVPGAGAAPPASTVEAVPPAGPAEAATADAVDPGAAVTGLLASWRGCAADAACAVYVLEDPQRGVPTAFEAAAADASAVEVVDEYGGAAAVRVTASDGSSRIVVVVRVAGKWLIRDVYDVADQL